MEETPAVIPIPANDGLLRTVKDLTAGAAGGVAQVLLGKLTHTFLPFRPLPMFGCTEAMEMLRIGSIDWVVKVNRSIS